MDSDAIDPRTIDVAHRVSDLSFRFYTDNQALRLSVRRLTSPHAFDELGRPISRGLYDTALGPASYDDGPCETCGLNYNTCPGHFGHIELPVPVPNPLLVKIILRLMRASCWTCPCLRASPNDLCLFMARLYFEDADMSMCGFAVEAFRTLRRRKSVRTEAEMAESETERLKGIVIPNWRGFLEGLPEPLGSYVKQCGSNDVDLIERNMLEAARVSWQRARKTRGLAKHRSKGWNETTDQILSSTTNPCPKCMKKPIQTRMGTRGRLFRKESHGEMLFAPSEIESHIKSLWKQHEELFGLMLGLKGREHDSEDEEAGYKRLFVQVVLVPPSRFRPTAKVGDMTYAAEHPQNMFFQRLLTEIEIIMKANEYGLAEDYKPDATESDKEKPVVNRPTKARFAQAMTNMQEALKDLYDSSGNMGGKATQMTGIRQQLEAKSGLFRQHMMGKRVNYSCRSVIGPDVFLDTDEIGIPESFAKLLTVPESVIPANLKQMQQAVLNGPDVYPGAVAVEDWTSSGEHRIVKFHTSKLKKLQTVQSSLLIQNRISSGSGKRKSNDAGRMGTDDIAVDGFHNRAGSIPKRVHRHLKTGDIVLFNRQPTLHRVSIMAHRVRVLPGERTIRFHYANCNSYNADFDGDEMNVHVPQDYLARAEAEELMLSSKHYIVPTSGAPVRGLIQDHIAAATLLSQRDTFFPYQEFTQFLYSATEKLMSRPGMSGRKYVLPEPAVYKPTRLWTGKQLISAVLFVIRDGQPGLNLDAGTKTKVNVIGAEESKVIFRDGQLLQGVIDKSALGSSMYGIVHAVQEAYGCAASDDFLSAMSRLCVFFLRYHGHTTGVDDLLLQAKGEEKRSQILQACIEEVGVSVTNSVYTEMSRDENRLPAAKTLPEARQLVEDMIRRDGKEAEDRLDTAMKTALNKVSSDVMKHCVPAALKKSFPKNGFALMTNTGAKGSAVNAAQISCLLGSTVLEGKRVPRMGGSGATLPCFAPYDASPIAGGFIASRFLTGISPQEFFFHAMSGREGLLDTSLKTANSGYLQRCLVKHMEGIRLHYDFTVRDSDNSVLQFVYGDDGIDPSKSRWLNEKIDWQVANEKCLRRDFYEKEASPHVQRSKVHEDESGTVMEALSPAALSKRGAISKSFSEAIEKVENSSNLDHKFNVRNFLEARYQESALEPGEAVGIVAAQGIGEPSTQMTLNTFHHAGSSSAHVTLGIPRLRELLMTAAKYPKTPSMTLPIRGKNPEEDAKSLARQLQSITLLDLLLQVEASEVGISALSGIAVRHVQVVLTLPPEKVYSEELGFGFDDILHFVGDWFLPDFHKLLKSDIKRVTVTYGSRKDASASMYLRVAQKPEYLTAMPRIPEEDRDEQSDQKKEGNKHGEGGEDTDVEDQSDAGYASSSDEDDDDKDEQQEQDEERDSRRRQKDLIEQQAGDKEGEEVDDVNKRKEQSKSVRKKRRPAHQNNTASAADDDEDLSKFFGVLGYVSGSLKRQDDTHIEFHWALPATTFGKLDIAGAVRESASVLKITHVDRITRCFIDKTADAVRVVTEGSNIGEIIEKGQDLVDLDRLETNDMYGILERYGVEAMRAALIQEFSKVFEAYAIPVNIRHLRLIADYMTAHGGYRGFNRHGMHSTPSPFQRMTFETSIAFLTDSALNGTTDEMHNPSAALATGQVYEGGTGGFELLQTVKQ